MLKELDLRANMPKDEYAPLAEALKPRLAWLQQEAIRENIPVIILFEGLSAAGKGAVTNSLILNFDARGFTVYNTRPPEPSELRLPWLARFVEKIPSRGRMAIFDRAWYSALSMGAGFGKRTEEAPPGGKHIRAPAGGRRLPGP